MFLDQALEQSTLTPWIPTFWRYNHRYDWYYHEKENSMSIVPKNIADLSWTTWVYMRDYTISYTLKSLWIQSLLDVGSDTWCFLAFCKMQGIDALGIDADKGAVDYIEMKWVNKVYHLGLEELMWLQKLGNQYDCLVCMNILHSPLLQNEVRIQFLDYIAHNYPFSVLTLKNQEEATMNHLELVQDFSILKFPGYRFLKPFQFRYSKPLRFFLELFWIRTLTEYVSIQWLYKSQLIP